VLLPLPPDPTLFSEAHPTVTPVFSILVPFHFIFVLLFKHIDMYYSSIVSAKLLQCAIGLARHLWNMVSCYVVVHDGTAYATRSA